MRQLGCLYLWKLWLQTTWFWLPSADDLAAELTNNAPRIVIDGQEYGIQIGGLLQHLAMPFAWSRRPFPSGLIHDSSLRFDKSVRLFGRQETFHIGGQGMYLVLIKKLALQLRLSRWSNPAPYPFSLSVLLNANYADGIDTSWIWDADFEQITDMDIPEINAGGVRHSKSHVVYEWQLSNWENHWNKYSRASSQDHWEPRLQACSISWLP